VCVEFKMIGVYIGVSYFSISSRHLSGETTHETRQHIESLQGHFSNASQASYPVS